MNTALALPALAETPRSVWRTGGIVVLYTAVFFGLLPLLVWELGHAFDRGFVLDALPRAVRPLGAALFGGGALLMLAAMAALAVRGRGWPISHLPPRLLVARGLYSRLRHPIYVGYVAATAGAGLFEASVGRGLLAPLVLAAGTFVYARDFEEPRLVARFGPAYSAYVQVTPLLPAAFTGALAGLAKRAWLRARPTVERLANHTVLFRARESVWVTYGALVAIGGVTGAVAAAPLLAGLGLAPGDIALYELGLAASMLAGGRLVWLAYEWRRVWREPASMLRRVGFVSFGGYAGFLLFSLLFALEVRLPVLGLFDRVVPPAFLISAWGRLGCLSYGCCYGRPCEHGLVWRDPHSKVHREQGPAGCVPRVPTPLLSAALAAGVAALGGLLLARGALPGAVAAGVLLAYAVARFGLEHFRDEPRLARRFTKGQLLCLPVALGSLVLLLALPDTAFAGVHADFSVLPSLLPAFGAIGALAFLVCGFHRREVGRW